MLGDLQTVPASSRPDLLAPVVAEALRRLGLLDVAEVAAIDPEVADTAAFCARYQVREEDSANCVIVEGRRGGESTLCGCVLLASTRLDVNGAVRRRIGAKKASFAPMSLAVEKSAMAYGGITPIGLPDWPLLVDARVAVDRPLVLGSGIHASKLVVVGTVIAALPGAEVLDGLAGPR